MTTTQPVDETGPGPARDLLDLFRELRHGAPRSNGQIAISTGLSRSYVSEIFSGRKVPAPDAAGKIAMSFGNSPHTALRARQLAESAMERSEHRRQVLRGRPPKPSEPRESAQMVSRRWTNDPFDTYARRARLAPFLLCLLPPALMCLALLPQVSIWLGLVGLALLCAIPALAEQIARDRGERIEAELFESWGGKPTTRLLRWRDATSRGRHAHLHARVQQVIGPALALPSEAEERKDEAVADDIYDTAVTILRAVIRRTEGPGGLVFMENRDYGFRRNTLGLRRYGIVTATAGMLSPAAAALPGIASRELMWLTGVAALAAALLVFWTRIVTSDWVERAARRYADRLFETVLDSR